MSLMDQQWCPTSVQVTVLQARGLRIKGKSGTNDAYAVMQVGKEKYQTSVAEKSVAPVWKEEAAFDLPPPSQSGGGGERGTLHVHVMHRALVGPDKLLGQAVINLLQLSEDQTRDKTEWFKLLDKTGKADKDRGEVLLDIQFMRNNMTASMFDLSAAGKSRSRLGKFKDKVRGKKKESDTVSSVVPSFTQVLTDSEEEANGEVAAEKAEKKKKHKMKSLFSPKSNLQRNMSQSLSVLPASSSLSGSQSSGLNVEASEGKKKFKFMMHKRSGSSDNKDSFSGLQKHSTVEQSNVCINGSHVYCEEPQTRTSRIGSNFSLTSSGHGSMEDVPERQYSPWTEEEEEMAEVDNIKENVDEEEEEERIRMEEESKKKEEMEERVRRQEEEKRRQEEEDRKRAQEEKVRREEEEKNKREEERKRREEEEKARREKLAEEKRKLEEQERRRIEEEKKQREEEERIKMEEKRAEEERRRQEEEERVSKEKEQKLAEEKRRLEEEERRRVAEEKVRREEKERKRREEEKAEEERRRHEEQERKQREEEERLKKEEERRQKEEERAKKEKEEYVRLVEEKMKLEEERKRIEAEEKIRRDEEQKLRVEEEKRRKEEEAERVRREKEEQEEKRRLEEQERRRSEEEEKRQREEQERIRKEKARRQEKEDRARKEKEEYERLAEEKRRQEEQERIQKEEAERIRKEEQERIRMEEKRRRQEEEERARKEREEIKRLAEEKRRQVEQENMRIEEEEKIRRSEEKKAERERKEDEARKLEKEQLTRDAEEQNKRENKSKDGHKAAGNKSKVSMEGPAEVTSTNPFGDSYNPFEKNPDSSVGPDSSTAKVSNIQQRCRSAVSSVEIKTISNDEKDVISVQRERRPAPQPPGRNQAERQCQRDTDVSTRHLAQANKQSNDKDIKTASVLPQRSVQMIAPVSRSPIDTKSTQSLMESCTTKGTTSAATHSKRPAPPRPRSVDEEPSSNPKTTLPSVGNISADGSEAKQVQIVYGLNPFEDDEDENEAQDDITTSGNTRSICWPPAVSQTGSETKIKSSKVAHAPPPPAGVTIPNTSATQACDPESEAKTSVHAQKSPVQGTQAVAQNIMEEAGVKKDVPPTTSRRLQPVKPLNPLEQQSVSIVQGEKDNSTGIFSAVQDKMKVNSAGLKGPYSQLTQDELISLVLKQKKQLSERDKKISELEQYIDNLLVRVMEEKPSILMSMSSVKKAV